MYKKPIGETALEREMVPCESQLKLLPAYLLPLNLFSYFLNVAFPLKNIMQGGHEATVNHATAQYGTHDCNLNAERHASRSVGTTITSSAW
jgi:hypothetical protein